NSNARSGTNSNSIDGANMTSDNMKDQTFFTTQANWDISIWDFNIWEIKLGAVRPTLIGVGDDDGTIMR
ncbi:MAG: hypothetical protein HRT66_13400, partial [Flavobacteriaceae bacterium]|nr:hypothetical protein [Flavobacteriaceae bacterium]